MEKVSIKTAKTIPVLVISFLILIGGLYSTVAKANTPTQPACQQLAYFVGYHSAPGYVYYGPRYNTHYHRSKLYWTGWRYVGHGCRKNCLVDRYSRRVIRCNRVCR